MLEQVLESLRNWFVSEIVPGEYAIHDGALGLPFLVDGQYFRIVGSIFNDGLHKYPSNDLTDEKFSGAVWALKIPKAVIDLSDEIAAWNEKNDNGPYQSESFGGYSYSKATDSLTGAPMTWQAAFRGRLRQWRKL